MPISKNATYRYQVLDKCFSDSNHKYGIDDLLRAVNERLSELCGSDSCIKGRQLRDDISTIRKMLPSDVYLDAIPYDGKLCYYRYTDPDFSIYKNELSTEEIKTLSSAIDMLGKFRGLPSNEWLEDVITNLEVRFGVKSNSDNLISFGQNDQLQGLEHLSTLVDATINHSPLQIVYKTYRDEEYTQTVHPYHMRQYNERWFLFGFNADMKVISNYALDRIKAVKLIDVSFIPNKDIDFSTYFDNIVGVSVPNTMEASDNIEIVLRFSPQRLPYVLSKPIHKTQEQLNETDIRICVYPTRELTQQILSFGEDVEVVAPECFRNEMAAKIREMSKLYFTVHNPRTDTL